MATPAKIHIDQLPAVVIVGRANVGKSTLFNKLLEEHKALVSDIAGTTRTNNEGVMLWRGKNIRLIDTGGLDSIAHKETQLFDKEIQAQAESAIREADCIVFVTDARSGILPQEKVLAQKLNQKNKRRVPILLVASKVDNTSIETDMEETDWLKLGFGTPITISGANGRQVGDFLDLLYSTLHAGKKRPKQSGEASHENSVTVSLVGKPNVGKSSLFNKLIGEEKVIVSPIAHTTRESFDTTVTYTAEKKKYTITFVDTAGMRRKADITGELERGGIQKSIESIEKSDIILLVIDGAEPISSQDLQLGGLIKKRSKSVILLVNKWDLAEDTSDRHRNEVKKMMYAHFPHLDFAPILFVSGLTGFRVQQIFPLIAEIIEARKTEIPNDVLDEFLKRIVREHRPARGKGTRYPEALGFKQVESNPPTFELFIKRNTSLHQSYLNYIENKLREAFNFTGTPLWIRITKMKK